ncbi:hypothetical protein [Salinarimonas sp.]|uniref:hypothetical protein n=1 Tax=Salinarimonas sp. TaxID=2766526 RepID=UPI0032D8D714
MSNHTSRSDARERVAVSPGRPADDDRAEDIARAVRALEAMEPETRRSAVELLETLARGAEAGQAPFFVD